MDLEAAMTAFVTSTFAGLGSLFLIGFVVVAGLALAYGLVRR